MAFATDIEFRYDNLPLETKYRFAELELNQAFKLFSTLNQYDPDRAQKAFNQIYQLLYSYSERYSETEEALHRAKNSHYFISPPKSEIITYMLYNQQSYKKIRELTKSSPNYIAQFRYHAIPHYNPVFTEWNETLLNRWDAIKHTLNLWNEDLVHYHE